MKQVVSVSLGSSARDKSIELEILGEKIHIERIGTNGNLELAGRIIRDYDGKVDAFGLGGADLGLTVREDYYPLHSVRQIAGCAKLTPMVDGMGLKNTLESHVADFLEQNLSHWLDQQGRKVFLVSAVSRWTMAQSFLDAGYSPTFGDIMFSLGLPIPVYSSQNMLRIIKVLCPIVTRLPFRWIYPVGPENETPSPRFERHYREATVVAGDCLYIKQALPDHLWNKMVVTNTTTEADVELFRKCGIKYLVTTTPVLEGRTFGTNVMEAVITACAGKKEPLSREELQVWIDRLGMVPQIRELN
jgi:hypothetical protein